jgi:mycothiol synthase
MRSVQEYGARSPAAGDAPDVAALIQAANLAEQGEANFALTDLEAEWGRARFDLARNAVISVAPGGAIAGYAWYFDRRPHVDFDADIHVHPDHEGRGIEARLLEEIERRVRAHAQSGQPALLHVPAYQHNEARHDLLLARGYAICRQFFQMRIAMEHAPDPPRVPDGLTLRPCRRGQDEAVLHEVLVAAFAGHYRHSPMPADQWVKRHTEYDFYVPDLWFLALDGNRPVGAVANLAYEDIGWVDELGVLEDWRGRGLGRALLQQSFLAFWKYGQPRVGLGVDAENGTGAVQLYESAGMHIAHRFDLFRKAVT